MRERLGDIAEEIGLDRHSSWTIKKGKLDPKFKAAIETENPEWILRGKVNRLSQSGALNSINDPDGIKRRKHAEVYYNSVKARNKDIVIQKIADSTGEDKEMAERVYNHVFVDKHNLAKGYGNFDPDYNMAQSFQRILAGEALEHDKILIKHENLEAMYMKQGMDYDSAHKKADLRYNYQKALDEFEKRKKNG